MRSICSIRPTIGVSLLLSLFVGLAIVVPGYAQADDTSVSASCPGPVFVNNTINCEVTVSTSTVNGTDDGTPQGDVSISPNDTGTVSNDDSCTNMTGTCNFDYTPTAFGDGSHSFSVSFSTDDGTKWNSSSNGNTGSHTVNRRTTSTTVSCSPGSMLVGESSTCTATVTDEASGNQSEPAGTISWSNTTGQLSNFPTTCSLTGNGDGTSSSCSVTYTPTANNSADTETHTLQASYPDGSVHGASSDTADVEVSKRETTTVVTCVPTEVAVDAETTCTATVADASGGAGASTPAGDVDFTVGPGSGDFDPASGTCTLSSGSCNVDYTPTTANPSEHTVNGAYQGSATHKTSDGDFIVKVRKRKTLTIVTCATNPLFVDQPTTCTARVEDNEQDGNESPPSGTVTFDDLDNLGEFTAGSGNPDQGTCNLSTGSSSTSDSWSSCDITSYIPRAGGSGTVTINAVYDVNGNSDKHETSNDQTSLTVEKRLTTTAFQCFPSGPQALVDEEVECTVTVTDVTQDGYASGPEGRVVLSTQQEGTFLENGSEFDETTSSCDLAPSGNSATCTVKYNANETETPIENHSLTAFYFDDLTDAPGTIDVPDDFENLQKHAPSSAGFSLAIQRRPTTTQIDCNPLDWGDDDDDLTPGGSITCWVRVIDNADNPGKRSAPGGTVEASNATTPDSPFATVSFSLGTVGSSHTNSTIVTYTDTTSPTEPFHVLLAIYEPDDKKHLPSGGTENGPAPGPDDPGDQGAGLRIPIDETNFGTPTGGSPGSILQGGVPRVCGDQGGGATIDVIQLNLTIQGIAFLLNVAADAVQLFPDTLVDVTDPIHAGLEQASQILELDSDGDGLVDVLEASLAAISILEDGLPTFFDPPAGAVAYCAKAPLACVGLPWNPFRADSDGDTIGDMDEVLIAGGKWSSSHTVWPDPTRKDSDGDGLLDGDEGPTFQSNLCDPDTDNDTLLDPDEISTYFNFSTAGYDISVGDLIGYQSDTRDQLNQLAPDTDGDGIPDADEATPGCNGGSDGFSNDDDSDDDGAQDGFEVAQAVSGTVAGGDLGNASGNDGELGTDTDDSICDADSDDDGLLDGVEHFEGTRFDDWDSDDDGLSDWEELQLYFTSPGTVDTDGDNAGNAAFGSASNNLINDRPSVYVPAAGIDVVVAGDVDCLSDCEEALSATTLGDFTGEIRDETDPLQSDTDGDGIQDDIEFNPGCNVGAGGTGTGTVLNDGYANSFDSDGDGASDGVEAGVAGVLAGQPLATVGGDVAAASGNNGELNDDGITNICDPDADGDGLLDGEELGENLSSATAGNLLGFLDWDSDDDGLSDREELQTYFTDPELADTDGDTADGVIAFRDPTFSDSAHPALAGHPDTGPTSISCLSDCEEAFSGTLQFNPFFAASPPGLPGFGNPLDETDPLQIDTDGDGINDNIEFAPGCNDGPGGPGTGTALFDGFANSFDSDADGLRDYEDAVDDVFDGTSTVDQTPVTRDWGAGLTSVLGNLETPLPTPGGTKAASPDGLNDGEINDDNITGICDPDSDGDHILDGGEHERGSDPYDWDSDDDGRSDAEFLGEGPIPSDPFDFDTDDDGIGDGVEVFASNTTNPVVADTDGDGLCDGGAETPASGGVGSLTGGTPIDGAGTNPVCYTGVADHPNPNGYGEDRNGDGNGSDIPTVFGDAFTEGCTPTPGACETDPNNPDTDSDGLLDGVEAMAYSTSRSTAFTDGRGRPSRGVYPDAANPPNVFSCLNPIDADSDEDGLTDGFEDFNHDGNWDFLITDFDHFIDPLGGQEGTDPEETNPCDADSDDDSNPGSTNAFGAAGGNSSDAEERQRGTNPLDFDSDNDLIDDGVEVAYICEAPQLEPIDNDNDGLFDEDPIDGLDNDGDGLIDEDPEDFTFITVTNLSPLARDSDSDGFIDGLEDLNLDDKLDRDIGETNPCASPPIPIVVPIIAQPADTDGDGFSDEDERAAGTDLHDPDSHPTAFTADLDLDGIEDDRLWLEDPTGDGVADTVAIDINSNVQVDLRIEIIEERDYQMGDFDEDGIDDDCRYIIVYAMANQRAQQPRIVLSIVDLSCDGVIDRVAVERRQ